MANPELGTKQICPNCQAKFYDLGRRPAHCPKCAHEFDPDEAVRNRRVRARTIVPEADEAEDQVVEKETDDDEEEEEGHGDHGHEHGENCNHEHDKQPNADLKDLDAEVE